MLIAMVSTSTKKLKDRIDETGKESLGLWCRALNGTNTEREHSEKQNRKANVKENLSVTG